MAEHLPNPPENPDLPARRVMTWVALVIGVVALVWAGYLQVQNHNKVQTAEQSANAGQDLASQVQAACAEGGDLARKLGALCQQAADVKAQPSVGIAGATGDRGPKGDRGDAGPQGPQGEAGPKGETGNTGDSGTDGQNGSQGQDGGTGAKGDPGSQGPKGDQGETGPEGPQGPGGEPAPRITAVDLDQASCTGTIHLSDGTSFPITMTGCSPKIGG